MSDNQLFPESAGGKEEEHLRSLNLTKEYSLVKYMVNGNRNYECLTRAATGVFMVRDNNSWKESKKINFRLFQAIKIGSYCLNR